MFSRDRLLELFLDMVRVDSPSRDEKLMGDWLMAYFKDKGIEATIDDAGSKYGGTSGNIVAHIPGQPGSMPLCFAAHTDQVSPCKGVKPIVEGNIVKSDGTTTLGADDKGGIAAILAALEDIMEDGVPRRDIYLLFTVSEETGMMGAKNFDPARLPCKDMIVMDAGGPTGAIAYQAPAREGITCTFIGRKAHAGLEPEKGINAIVVAADAISKMHIGRIDPLTTSNIGRIEGGDVTNVVTDRVSFTAEIRAHDMKMLEAEVAHMRQCCEDACKKHGATCEFKNENAYPSFSLDRESELFKLTCKAMEDVGITPDPQVIGGGSDANVLAGKGYRSAILSLGMYKVHTVEEYLDIEDLCGAQKILRKLMEA